MNRLILLLFLSAFCILNATTLEVSLDGTHQYTSIQSAIVASNNGDTVLVHPGRYFENIDFIGKNITVCSEYMNNPDWGLVESTIIDGNQLSSCVIAINGEQNATIYGLTITNGIGYGNTIYRYGGGIFIWEASSLTVNNCIVENNSSITSGGIYCTDESNLTLAGNIIRNNRATYQGGGLGVRDGTVIFDPVNLNSIYNNYGDTQDICLYDSICTDIILDTLSIAVTQPDGYFVSHYNEDGASPPQVSVQNSFFTQTDADLYVSPEGNDANNGLTPETALKTIAYANRIVQPDSLDLNTVYLLPGIYSKQLNDQFFPLAVQSNTRMLGTGETPEDVVFGNELGDWIVQSSYSCNTEIGNFTVTMANESLESVLVVTRSNNVYMHDIICHDNYAEYPGALIMFSNNSTLENITIKDVNHNFYSVSCIKMYECENIFLNGIVVSVNNMVITNSRIHYPGVIFSYGNPQESEVGGNLMLNNLLVYNNTSLSSTLPMVNFHSYFDESFINNMTIAYNTGPTAITRFGGDYTVRNSIIYNPDGAYDLGIWVPANGDPYPLWSNVDIDYCLVRNGLNGVAGATNPNNNVLWGSHNIDADPLFRGDVNGEIPVGDPRYVQLSQNSPCVDAGTPDTLGMNLPADDVTGNPRIWNNIIDMGAHEYNPTVDNAENTFPVLTENIAVSHFPNPVFINSDKSGCAFIEFTLPKKPIKKPTLEIYNIRGQKVRSIKITQSLSALVRSAGLSTEEKQSGEHYSQIWDCRDDNRKLVTSGIYFYKVRSEGKEALGKMMVLK
jgi:hypothetical protein